jgi:L-arabinose isomerase
MPDLKRGAAAWILSGGAHHTGFSSAITTEYLEDFAIMTGVEFVKIDESTELSQLRDTLKWNELYYHIAKGIL